VVADSDFITLTRIVVVDGVGNPTVRMGMKYPPGRCIYLDFILLVVARNQNRYFLAVTGLGAVPTMGLCTGMGDSAVCSQEHARYPFSNCNYAYLSKYCVLSAGVRNRRHMDGGYAGGRFWNWSRSV